MGKLFNSIISNDIAFYSLIFFLVAFLIVMIIILKKKSKKTEVNKITLEELNAPLDEPLEKIEKVEKKEKKEEKSKLIIHNKTDEMIETFASDEKSKQILKDIMQETENLEDDAFSSIDKIMNEIEDEKVELEKTMEIKPIEKIEEKESKEETVFKKIEPTIEQEEKEEIEKTEEKHEQIEFNIDQIIDETEKQLEDNKKETKNIMTLATKMNELESNAVETKTTRLEKFNQATKAIENNEVKVEQNESKDTKSELEKVLEKMQKDLDEQKETDVVALFEQEQEERAIISYKELLEKKDELIQMTTDERFENEKEYETEYDFDYEKYIDEYNKEENKVEEKEIITPIVENSKTTIDIPEIKEDNTEKPKKFVTTDFISPVFGRREAELDYPKVHNISDVIKTEKTNEYDLEATMNLDPIKEKIQQDDAFLSALKEFRKKLE